VVQANLLACVAGAEALGGAYNIGCGERITLNALIAAIGDIMKKEIQPDYEDPREGDIRHSLAAIDAAAERLGFRPEVALTEGLLRTVEAY
jgi:nucleoside-diphosphate-sugar epimerase